MPDSYAFRPRHRIRHARDFRAVFAAKIVKPRGPIIVHALPTDRTEPRLGLSIGRRVGNAVTRNALKRRLREAFRLAMPSMPSPPGAGAYDLVISAKRHDLLDMPGYRALLEQAIASIHRDVCRRTEADHDTHQP